MKLTDLGKICGVTLSDAGRQTGFPKQIWVRGWLPGAPKPMGQRDAVVAGTMPGYRRG
jgi:hypothetical protein